MSYSFLKGHKESITCMINHPKGLISGSEDKTVRIWDTRANRAVKCITGEFYDEIACISEYPQNENMVCVGCDQAVFCYDLRNPGIILKNSEQCIAINNDCVDKIRPFTMEGKNYVGICDDAGDIVVWNCDENVEYITLEGVHKNICGDFFIRKEGENVTFVSGGYDQVVAVTTIDCEMTESWKIGPLSSSLPSVNPPFIVCLTENPVTHAVYCGCGDGSIRGLTVVNGEHLANAVVNVHGGSISDLLSIERNNRHFLLSTGNDMLFAVHEETNKNYSLFSEKIRMEMKWNANAFVVDGDDVFFGGLSNQILCAKGIFRCFCVCLQKEVFI